MKQLCIGTAMLGATLVAAPVLISINDTPFLKTQAL